MSRLSVQSDCRLQIPQKTPEMRILFSMRHTGALRNFASTLQALAERNHQVHLVFAKKDKEGDHRLLEQLARDFPAITYEDVPRKAPWAFWVALGRAARYTVDYARYLTPEFADVKSLKDRARAKAPAPMRWFVELPIFRSAAAHRLLIQALLALERAIPIDDTVLALVARTQPDVLLVTPLVDIGSDQVDYVKAGRRLGVRSALPVLSWDNLTNKGLIRVQPDQVYVWNEAQKAEAIALHGTRADDVVVTGAMVYDQWFARRPTTTRDEFCARVGLNAARPILLYLCSSPFIAPDEVNFIEKWIAAIRDAPDPRVRTAEILIRPHPENLQPWHRFADTRREGVAVWPRGGASPVDFESRNDFFDSMYHAAAAIGINTSAQIECGIVGRPVFSVRTPEYKRTQEGTLHFHHLTTEGGGLLHLADDLPAHVRQIAAALDDVEGTKRRIDSFVKAFTRPHGLDREATPAMVDAIERFASTAPPAPRRPSVWIYPVRAVLLPVGAVMKIVRGVGRVTRKRKRQLRPVTPVGTLVQMSMAVFDWLFRFRPFKDFVKQHVVPRALSRLSAADVRTEEDIAAVRMLREMSQSGRRIIVGPWVSEVGYELLYWIPFLRWAVSQGALDRNRLVVVSRGGCRAWYRDIADEYIDLFDYLTPTEFLQRSEQRTTDGLQKPRTTTEFDRDTLKLVAQTLNIREHDLLHPMHMYRLFHGFWQNRVPPDTIEKFAVFTPLPRIDTSGIADRLPADYVAARFHFNDAFPETDANRRFAIDLLSTLADTTDVVMLTPPVHIDDHAEVSVAPRGRVHDISHLMSARTNLDVQSKVIAGARAFVGTHGGLSYLSPFYGVKSLSFYSHTPAFAAQHMALARRVFARMSPGSYVALDVKDIDTLRATLGAGHEAIAAVVHRLS
jgi:hypothetical protein